MHVYTVALVRFSFLEPPIYFFVDQCPSYSVNKNTNKLKKRKLLKPDVCLKLSDL